MISFKQDISPLMKLAIPLALTGLVNSAVWFFETIFLAHLSPEALAAGSLVSWLFGTLAVILFGALSSINILVAHKHGEGDQEKIAWIARDGLLLAVLLTVPAIILFWNIAPVLLLFGQSEAVVELAMSYLHALSWGLLANFMIMACLEVIIGIGNTRIIFLFSLLTVSLNIIFSYAFIFGKFGLRAFGVEGAGWGMTASYCITACVLVIFLLSNQYYKPYFRHIFSLMKPRYLKELLQIGIPMGFMYCVEVAFFFALTLAMGLLGTQIQAANQVALQYVGIFMSIMFAIAQAVTVRMGHLLGAKEVHSAGKVSAIGISLAVVLMCIIAGLYWLSPGMFIAIDFDVHNPANSLIVDEIKKILLVAAVFQIVESARIVLFGSLRGLKQIKFTLLISIISFWFLALPIGYWLAIRLAIGATGFWWGMVIGASFSVIVLQWWFKRKMKHYYKVNRSF